MPRRETGVLTRVISQFSADVRAIEGTRAPHAQFWDEWNTVEIDKHGPLWVALGDSTSQGIGATDPNDSWVMRTLRWLRSDIDPHWRLINLSITGAQFGDIVEHQLPRLASLSTDADPQLVTLLAGANNLMAPGSWPRTLTDLRTILDVIPERSVVARVGVSSMFNSVLARRINAQIESFANAKDLKLFWPWAWPSRDGLAADKWHPSDVGYRYLADLARPWIAEAVAPQ